MSVFMLSVDYLVPLEQIDQALDAHRAWVDKGFQDGLFLLSGPKIPRTGGAILAYGNDRAEVEARIAEDPFVIGGLARYTVYEMAPRTADPRLAFLIDS